MDSSGQIDTRNLEQHNDGTKSIMLRPRPCQPDANPPADLHPSPLTSSQPPIFSLHIGCSSCKCVLSPTKFRKYDSNAFTRYIQILIPRVKYSNQHGLLPRFIIWARDFCQGLSVKSGRLLFRILTSRHDMDMLFCERSVTMAGDVRWAVCLSVL